MKTLIRFLSTIFIVIKMRCTYLLIIALLLIIIGTCLVCALPPRSSKREHSENSHSTLHQVSDRSGTELILNRVYFFSYNYCTCSVDFTVRVRFFIRQIKYRILTRTSSTRLEFLFAVSNAKH